MANRTDVNKAVFSIYLFFKQIHLSLSLLMNLLGLVLKANKLERGRGFAIE